MWVRGNLGHAQIKGCFYWWGLLHIRGYFRWCSFGWTGRVVDEYREAWGYLGPDLCSAELSQRPHASGSGPDPWSSLAQYRGKGKVSETGVKQTSRWVMVILVLCHRYPRGPSLSGDQFMTPTFEKRHQNLFVLFDWCWRWDLLFGIRSTFRWKKRKKIFGYLKWRSTLYVIFTTQHFENKTCI